MTGHLEQFMAEMIPAVEREMRSVLQSEDRQKSSLYGMMHYHMGWADETFQSVELATGKRIRPVLLLLSCAAAGADWRTAIPAAAAVELLHNFTLIHDDIQDASPTRRGRPTVWQNWGVAHAINVGDAMFALSHAALYRLFDDGVDPAVVVRAARCFDETCVALTVGQYHDMEFEDRQAVSVEDYIEMIGGKTAALLALCGEIGALVAGANDATIGHYAIFARELGLAFQVKDDILGIWGDEAAIGKSSATDIETRKKTLPVLYGLQQSDRLQALYRQTGTNHQFVEEVDTVLAGVGVVGRNRFTHAHRVVYL